MKRLSVSLLVALVLVLLAIEDTVSKKMSIEEAKKTIKNLRKVCSKKNDTPKELLDGQFRGEFPQDERLMCYMKCILISTKAMKNDVILWDFFVKNARMILLEEYIPRVESVVETCKKEVTATEGCEVAWQFGKCIYENDKEVIFKYDYAENNTLALFSAMNDLSIENSRYYRGSKRNFYTPAHRRYLGHHVHNRGKAVCRNTRTKPQCRRV